MATNNDAKVRDDGRGVPPMKNPPVRLADLLRSDYEGPAAITSFVGSGLDAVRTELRYKGKADLTVEDLEGKPFQLVHYFVHPVELQNREGGELVTHLRTVMVNPDGETVSTVSGGIIDALQTIIDRMGPGPWLEPLPVAFRRIKTRMGFGMLTLAIVDPAEAKAHHGRSGASKAAQ